MQLEPVKELRQRKSFREVEKDHYVARNKDKTAVTELEKLILAWKGIQTLPPDDPNSFFVIGGYHGEPFRGAGWSNNMWWGGYCSHGQILFPTWHRAYLFRLENALRSIKGCEDVAMPFIDWCDVETATSGVPDTFTSRKFILANGDAIDNPLFSYKFQTGVFDNRSTRPATDYTKLKDYETVRYPKSGLVGLPGTEQENITKKWNSQFTDEKAKNYLNFNIRNWLRVVVKDHEVIPVASPPYPNGTWVKFKKCLDVKDYVLFSNTSSASQFNQEQLNREKTSFKDPDALVISLESPHNDMHLAIGGFTFPKNQPPDVPVPGAANGDMGENETAALDPIFFFHHCFIDRIFWLWQQKHGQTRALVMNPKFKHYPGTNNVDMQGPTVGQLAGEWLDLSTPLMPFTNADMSPVTSNDVVDIEGSLGYTYGPGSFSDSLDAPQAMGPAEDQPVVGVSGITRETIAGSFIVGVYAYIDGERTLIHYDSVLSRWNVQGCANCQANVKVKSFVPVQHIEGFQQKADIAASGIEVDVITHEGERNAQGVRLQPAILERS